MDEYISRHCMIKTVLSLFITEDEKLLIINRLKSIPAADVRPVVHGKWTLNKDGSGTCSVCGRTQNNCWDLDNYDNFCRFCGADMRQKQPKEDNDVRKPN